MTERRKRKREAKSARPARRLQGSASTPPVLSWFDEEGLHFAGPGRPLSPAEREQMTLVYQQKIRDSPLWDTWVKEYGEQKAEQMLQQCRVEERGGFLV